LGRAGTKKFKNLARAIGDEENDSKTSRFLRAPGEKFRELLHRRKTAPRRVVAQAKDSDDPRALSVTWRILCAPGEKFREPSRGSNDRRFLPFPFPFPISCSNLA
jgi:hypothetical protein